VRKTAAAEGAAVKAAQQQPSSSPLAVQRQPSGVPAARAHAYAFLRSSRRLGAPQGARTRLVLPVVAPAAHSPKVENPLRPYEGTSIE